MQHFICSSIVLSILLQSPSPAAEAPNNAKDERGPSKARSRSREARRRRSRAHRKPSHRSRRRRSRSRRRHGEGRTSSRRRSRSRSKSRSHRHRRHRGRSSSRSRHGHRRRRSRSRSRQRRHRSRSPSSRRARSRDRSRDRSRERSRQGASGGLVVGFSRRSRSRSRDGIRSNFARGPARRPTGSPKAPRPTGGPSASAADKKTSFKDQMRQQFMQAGLALGAASLMSGIDGTTESIAAAKEKAEGAAISANMSEEELYKLAATNPQVARVLMMRNRAEALTGVSVPKYYSLSAVNPLKYAEQMQKRKMLWSRTKDTTQKNEALWTASSSAVAGSGEDASRFRKLMGIKDGPKAEEPKVEERVALPSRPPAGSSEVEAVNVVRKQEELFRNLDKEYEFARVVTHSARGVGLGYSSQAFIDPNQFQR